MTFIFSWATEHRLIIAGDTVSSDSGKTGCPPIKINVNKIYPISKGIVGISIGTDHFDYKIDSNDTVGMIFDKVTNKELSEAKNVIESELQQAFVRYKNIKDQKHGRIFTEIDPTEVTLLYWIHEFNSFWSETIKIGIENGKVYCNPWEKKRLEKTEEWGLKGFRNNPEIGNIVKEKDHIILQTNDFDKITNTIESLFCFIYRWLRTTTQYSQYGWGSVNIYAIEKDNESVYGRWLRKES